MARYDLFHKGTKAFVDGNQLRAVQRMLDFDYMCRKDSPSVVGIITPEQSGFEKFFWGTKEVVIHRFRSVAAAVAAPPEADPAVNFARERSAYASTREMLDTETIRVIAVIAEGVPERHARELRLASKQKGKWIIGPATVGGIKAGCFRIGNRGGALENIKECH